MKGLKMLMGIVNFIFEVLKFIVYIPFFIISVLFEMLGPFLIAGIVIAGIAYSTQEDKGYSQSSVQETNTTTVTKENW